MTEYDFRIFPGLLATECDRLRKEFCCTQASAAVAHGHDHGDPVFTLGRGGRRGSGPVEAVADALEANPPRIQAIFRSQGIQQAALAFAYIRDQSSIVTQN